MREYSGDRIRNVVLASHQGTGKTSLVEAMLFSAGHTTRLGKVDEGNTVSDWDPDEIKHKVSINATLAPVEWSGFKINLIDTPGYADFVGEVCEGMRVADAAMLVVSAVDGLQVGTEMAWDRSEERNLAKLIVVNKMDRENADFGRVIEQLREHYGKRVAPMEVPIGSEHDFHGVINVLHNKAYSYSEGKSEEIPVPAELSPELEQYRQQLVESICETDDDLVAKYLDDQPITDDELTRGMHVAAARGEIVPVMCCAATANVGVDRILDALTELMPGPLERPAEVDGTLAALVFKTIADPYVGKLTFLRVFSGSLTTDSHVFNSSRDHDEHIGPLLVMRGKTQDIVHSAGTGDIVAVSKLHDTGTGDTLTTKESHIRLDPVLFPAPSFSACVGAKSKGDLDKLGQALHRTCEEDPTLHVERDLETGETILSGIGESHLNIAAERLLRKYGVEVELSAPTVPYRETILGTAKAEGKHKKQSGGRGQFGDVWVQFEPGGDQNFEFVNKVVGGAVPKQYIPAVEKGIQEAMQHGPLAGCPVINVKATLYDGKYHDVDSSEMAFKIAGSLAFKEGVVRADPVLLEPIMALEVLVPENHMGDVIGDLNSKRARVLGMEPVGNGMQRVLAHVPMAETTHYATALRSITQGRGSFTTSLLTYEPVPQHVAQKIIEAQRDKHTVGVAH